MQNFREEDKFLKVIKHRQPIGMTDYSGVRGFSGDSMAKYCLLMQKTPEMWVPSLIQEDPLEKEMATHSSILLLFFFFSLQYSCLKNPMERGAWQATVYGVKKRRA